MQQQVTQKRTVGDPIIHNRPSESRSYDTQNDEHVRMHYNSVRNSNRNNSKMLQLRDFNNFVKWLMIFEFSEPYQIALDLACGKGGDLEKWRRAGIDGLIGVDIADVSIENASERYRELRQKSYWIDLVVGNCFGESFSDILDPGALPVDVVSCQFALHYAFDTMERVHQTLSNVSMALKQGGKFFGTIPNPDYLTERLRGGETEWGNRIFHIKFDPATVEKFRANNNQYPELSGNMYTFFLSEAVKDVPEYVVVFDKFVEIARQYKLKLVLKEPFLDYFSRKVHESEAVLNEAVFRKLTNSTGVPSFDRDQLEVCGIYLVFAFEKMA